MENNQQIEQLELEQPKKQPLRCRLSTAIISSVACLLVGALVVLIFVPNALRMYISGNPLDKITLVDQLIKDNYIDIDKVDSEELVDLAAWGYVYGLNDPYSTYYDAQAYTELQYTNSGGTHGIGISGVYYGKKNGIYIVRVTPNSPAQTAKLKAGDVITMVDSITVTEENYMDAINAIKGDKGTKIKLTVERGGKTQEFEVTRDDFTTESVYSRMIGDKGYIAITTFNEATVDQFKDCLKWVQDKGATGIIFDLRGNGGGLLDPTSEMLDMLLGEGEIGYAEYQGGKRKRLAWSDKDKVDLPFAVIIDGGSASSSEYFASALRDSGSAVLVGNQSYGKGIMQTTYSLGDGSALRVTTARVYTKSGTDYHKVGLKPDKEASYTEQQAKAWFLLSDSEEPYIQAAVSALSL